MPLYKQTSNPAAMAQAAMSGATQAAASQMKQTTTKFKRDTNFWDDLYKGAAALNMGARAVEGVVNAADNVRGMYDEYKIRNAYNTMSKAYAEGGIEALQANPEFQDYHHAQALGRIMKDRSASEKGRAEMLQNAKKIAEQNYNDVRAALIPGLEAYKAGDMDKFSSSMVNASNLVNMPYKIEPDKSGSYKVLFRSDANGGWTDTGRTMSAQEVFDMGRDYLRGEVGVLSGLGMKITPYNQRAILEGMRRAMATSDTNSDNMANYSKHIPLLHPDGQLAAMAIPQNPLDGSLDTRYEVFGMDGKPLGQFDIQGILQRGMRFPNMVQKTKSGGGGTLGPGRGSEAHIAMLNAGYVWDKDQKWYFKAGVDMDGKPRADYSQPAKRELYQALAQRHGGAGGGDPLGLLGRKQNATFPSKAPGGTPSKADAKIRKAATEQKSAKETDGTNLWDEPVAASKKLVDKLAGQMRGLGEWATLGPGNDDDYPY